MLKSLHIVKFGSLVDTTLNLATENTYDFNENVINDGIVKDALLLGLPGSGKTTIQRAISILKRLVSNHGLPEFYSDFESVFTFHVYEKDCLVRVSGDDGKLKCQVTIDSVIVVNHADVGTRGCLAEIDDTPEYSAYLAEIKHFIDNTVIYDFQSPHADESVHSILKEMIQWNDDKLQLLNTFLERYRLRSDITIKNGRVVFDSEEGAIDYASTASSGDRVYLRLFTSVIMKEGKISLLCIDNFNGTHPLVERKVAEDLFQTSSQKIIVTNNTGLLSNTFTRPDAIFNIGSGEIVPFYALYNKELRKAHNLEKMYVASTLFSLKN